MCLKPPGERLSNRIPGGSDQRNTKPGHRDIAMAVVERLVIVSPSFRGDTGLSILTVIVFAPEDGAPRARGSDQAGPPHGKGSSGLMLNPLIACATKGLPRRRYGVADGCMLPLDNRSWDR
jgi:hypothetical protein